MRAMKTRLVFAVALLTLVAGLAPAQVAAAPPAVGGLDPGQQVTFEQDLPINIVFLGYSQEAIRTQGLRNRLPASYEPVVRYPRFYGLTGRDMGLRFNFDYNVSFTSGSLNNRFFNYLKQIGKPGDPTDIQLMYNDQAANVLDVAGRVLYIDAPSVEGWLARNLTVDQPGYTIVFVNWYGRPDFRFHVYTKTDEPDPDTGYNFGAVRPTRKMIAWGGTSSRLWFYDLSAGPEAWAGSWNVDDADLDGDDEPDYRLPPIWEYAPGGYRKASALSRDLGLVTRYVAINLLFTSSPLYDPLLTAPDPGGRKVVHINMFEDDPDSHGTEWLSASYVQRQLASFQPYYRWRTNLVDRDPIDQEARRALRIFAGVLKEDDCWNAFGDPFAELFCYFDANRDRYIPAYRAADYVTGVFAFNTTAANLGQLFGLLGFADDNWVDGTQSYVFEFGATEYRELGYGFSTTTVHEVGHHIGLSHPHDGYDSKLDLDYGPEGDFYFAWSGDESDTVMSYLDVTGGFGVFDRDNMYRYEFAGYLNWANDLVDDILAHRDVGRVQRHLARASAYSSTATQAFDRWNYLRAASDARRAYVEIATAANILGIATPTVLSAMTAPTMGAAPHEPDPIRFPNN